LDRVRDAIRLDGYSVRTEEAYAGWVKRFIFFHDKRHPREMGYSDIKAFLLHLAVEETIAAQLFYGSLPRAPPRVLAVVLAVAG